MPYEKPRESVIDRFAGFDYLGREEVRRVLQENARACGSHGAGQKWHCVESHHQQELLAAASVRESDGHFPCILPMHAIDRRRKGRTVNRRFVTLFPRYMFVAFDPDGERWRTIASLRGVRRLIGLNPERPEPVPDLPMAEIIGRTEERGFWDERRALKQLPSLVGETVSVLDGPFTSFAGICTMSSNDRVRVMLGMFGRETQVEMLRTAVQVQ